MEKKKKFIVLGVLISFGMISFFLDAYLANFITTIRFSPLSNFLKLLENFTVELVGSILLFLVFSVIFWKKNKEKYIIFLFLSMFIAGLFSIVIQQAFARPRPSDIKLIEIKIDIWRYSFPSGHTAVAFSAVPIFIKVLPKFKMMWISLASLVGFFRLYVGAHYLSDVVFGCILGWVVGISVLNWKKIKEHQEIKRHVFHATLGVFLVVMVYQSIMVSLGGSTPFSVFFFLPPISRVFFFFIVIGVILVMISRDHQIPVIEWFLNVFERSNVRSKFPGKGCFFFFLGAFVISLFFERNVIAASLIILAVGDPTSHFVGANFGRVKHPLSDVKNIEGNITGAILGGIGASIFVHPILAFTAAFIAMFIEGISLTGWKEMINEDNLIIPLVSSLVIFSMKHFLF